MSRDADTVRLSHFKIMTVEAVSDKHRACVVRNAYSKESITRSDFCASAMMSGLRPKKSTRRLKRGGAEERRTRSSADEIGVSIRVQFDAEWSTVEVCRDLVEPKEMRAAACDNYLFRMGQT